MEPLPEVENLAAGQIWSFTSKTLPGRCHRLVIGDCRDEAVVARAVAGGLVTGVMTSPPYGNQRKRHYGGVEPGAFVAWFEAVQGNIASVLAADGSLFLNIKAGVTAGETQLYVFDLVLTMARRWGWRFIDDLLWLRQGFPGRFPNRFKNAHEPVFHFSKTIRPKIRPKNVLINSDLTYALPYANGRQTALGLGHEGQTGRNVRGRGLAGALPSNVIRAYTGAHSRGIRYGATFPVDLPSFFIRAYSDPGDVWLDPFAGSGTVAEAAEANGRLACLIDNNPLAARKTMERLARLGLKGDLLE